MENHRRIIWNTVLHRLGLGSQLDTLIGSRGQSAPRRGLVPECTAAGEIGGFVLAGGAPVVTSGSLAQCWARAVSQPGAFLTRLVEQTARGHRRTRIRFRGHAGAQMATPKLERRLSLSRRPKRSRRVHRLRLPAALCYPVDGLRRSPPGVQAAGFRTGASCGCCSASDCATQFVGRLKPAAIVRDGVWRICRAPTARPLHR